MYNKNTNDVVAIVQTHFRSLVKSRNLPNNAEAFFLRKSSYFHPSEVIWQKKHFQMAGKVMGWGKKQGHADRVGHSFFSKERSTLCVLFRSL